MEIRLAKEEEVFQIEAWISKAANILKTRGILQWERFLNLSDIDICKEDFKKKKLYVLVDDFNNIVGSMSFGVAEDIDYRLWEDCYNACFIHRLVISDEHWGNGYGEMLVQYAKDISKSINKVLRINAVENNKYLFQYYLRQDLRYVGKRFGYNLFQW